MYEVEILKDNKFRGWKKGDIVRVSNMWVEGAVEREEVRVIRYLGNFYNSIFFLKEKIEKLKMKITDLQMKLKYNEDLLKRKEMLQEIKDNERKRI